MRKRQLDQENREFYKYIKILVAFIFIQKNII